MNTEYKVTCDPLAGSELAALMRKLPSPISRPAMREIYNFRIDKDGYYLVDRGIDQKVSGLALKLFVDAALSTGSSAQIHRL